MRQIEYNSQRDNFDFRGKFSGWSQCFSTCAWMFICYYLGKKPIDYDLAEYVSRVEAQVGVGDIAQRVLKWAKWITGFTSTWWLVQREGIQEYLKELGGKVIYTENVTFDDIDEILKRGPVIIATNKLPGLNGGHIILLVDQTESEYYVNDPFGNATTAYLDHNGEAVKYNKKWLAKFADIGNKKGRIIYYAG